MRVALLALMLLGLVLSIALPEAFTTHGLAFAAAYAAMQVGRTGFMYWAVRDHPVYARNFLRILCWFLVSAMFWIGGGLADPSARLVWWASALGMEFVAPALAFWTPILGRATTAEWDVETSHLAERCAQFILIALGEALVVIGATFAETRWDGSSVSVFIAAFLGAAALWWIYFDTAAENTREAFAKAADAGALARTAYTYAHAALVAGIVVTAVGAEQMLAHPHAPSNVASLATIVGGPALYLAGNGVFRWLLYPRFPRSHLIGLGLLAAGAVVGLGRPIAHIGGGAAAAIVATALLGSVLHARRRARRGVALTPAPGSL